METLTYSFPSSNRVALDNVIFYRGPSPRKSRKAASTDNDEWPDINEILAQAALEDWTAGIEEFDFSTGFDNPSEGGPRQQHSSQGQPL